MDEALRIILPVYLIAYFGIAFAWRSISVWRQTGINPYVLGKTDSAYDYIGVVFRLVFGLQAAAILLFSVFRPVYVYTVPIAWLDHGFVKWIGLFLLFASLAWTATAQMQMGASWRIGIDKQNRTALVNKGLFTVSRNPIFLGMRIALQGIFLAIPSAVTLLTFVLGDVLIQIQVRLEEEHLRGLHGQAYEDYCGQVRRWI
jgi:protein-S-isoprenylcysteine O-methyltransferase Ste14